MTRTSVEYTAKTGLPKKTKSICPECGKIIEATILEKNGMVMMEKDCPEHGHYSDKIWTDVDLYLKAEKYATDGIGIHNSMNETIKDNDDTARIVIDNEKIDMLSCTMIANVDLTNRCNMHCPICPPQVHRHHRRCQEAGIRPDPGRHQRSRVRIPLRFPQGRQGSRSQHHLSPVRRNG